MVQILAAENTTDAEPTAAPIGAPEFCDHERARLLRMNRGMSRLVVAVQELSLARDLDAIMAVVRRAARELTGADGATLVLRDGDFCHYADEDAIAPLWKGQRFPLHTCISGWAMLNRQAAVIEDIYADARIPVSAYRPTFVKSLAMVPIRADAPIGAIGNYWATQRMPTAEEVELLQALANTTSVAMENVRVYRELEQRVQDRTAELEAANKGLEAANRELDSFSHAVSHDLGAPLRCIRAFTEMVLTSTDSQLGEKSRSQLQRVAASAVQMRELMDDLLRLSRVTRSDITKKQVDLSAMARDILTEFSSHGPPRAISIEVAETPAAHGDAGLLRIVLENLLSNAWKYTSKSEQPRIEFGTVSLAETPVYFVRDNGAGFDMTYAGKLFQPFQRLHRMDEFPGSGVGLTTVQRIVQRHGGRVWAEAAVNQGAAFYFTLGFNK